MNSVPSRLPNLHVKGRLMSGSEIERTLVRLAHQIVEKNNGVENLVLVGIKRRGVPLATRLAALIGQIEKTPVPVGTLDITLYRDDLSTVGASPVIKKATPLGTEIVDKNVICVLIDRGHRELPIEAAFIGRTVQTTDNEIIEVKLSEVDQEEQVLLVERTS